MTRPPSVFPIIPERAGRELLEVVRGCTFDDFILRPQKSVVVRRDPAQIDLSCRLSRHIVLNRPIVSANMDTVTRAPMAIVQAEEGGIGIIDRGFRPGEIELSTGTLEADLVVTCIGYSGEEFPKRDDVFPVGWAKRGPTGTIPTNRAESHAVAQEVLAFLKDRDPKSGPDVLPIAVDAAGWHRIDKHEVAAGAAQGRPRVKLTDWQALLDVAQDS